MPRGPKGEKRPVGVIAGLWVLAYYRWPALERSVNSN